VRVQQRAGDRVANLPGRRVFDLDDEAGGGNAGIAVVEGNKGIERMEADAAGKLAVIELDGGEGKLADKLGGAEVRQALEAGAPDAEAEALPTGAAGGRRAGLGRMGVADQGAGVEQFSAGLSLNRKVRKAEMAALVGLVEDLPIDEGPVAGQPNRPAADPAEGK